MHEARLAYLDQVRGYAIFGMILVNVSGMFNVMPWMLKHHHAGFSYADHIAPLFLFIVGLGYHMSFERMVRLGGLSFARRRSARRYAVIAGLGLLYGGFDLQVSIWDALMDIGVSGLLALPFMHRSPVVRVLAGVAFLVVYQALFSFTGYGAWVLENSINGGPFGPLSWVFILLLGTAAHDAIQGVPGPVLTRRFLSAALVLAVAGWALRAEWAGFKDFWPFSPYGMTAPYPLYATALCFVTVLGFYLFCEVFRLRLPLFTTLGKNPLVIYLLQAALVLALRMFISPEIGMASAMAAFLAVLLLCYGFARYLEIKGRIIKIG